MSEASIAGSMILVPYPPIDLLNDAVVTSASQIKFTWSDGPDGGSPIFDYKVYYDQSTGNYVLLQDGITDREFVTTTSLTAGALYSFRVSARNQVGEGGQSEIISIYAATVPNQPVNLSNDASETNAY